MLSEKAVAGVPGEGPFRRLVLALDAALAPLIESADEISHRLGWGHR